MATTLTEKIQAVVTPEFAADFKAFCSEKGITVSKRISQLAARDVRDWKVKKGNVR